MVVMGLKMVKKVPKIAYVGVFCHFRPVTTIKTLQKYFYLVEEVLSFDLVGHMWKLVKNWFQKCIFCGKFCEKFLLACLESVYSLIWGSTKIWGRVVGTPWTFYDK